MTSIRDFAGPIFLCSACGQPCFEREGQEPLYGPYLEHFIEQWDGVYCHMHPLADEKIVINWDPESLEDLKELYPDTHPTYPSRTS